MSDFSEDQFRTRLVKHMTRRPEPARPADYRAESPRLLGELVDGIRAEDAIGRGRLDARQAFDAMRGTDAAKSLIGGLIHAPALVAGDRDVFGAGMLSRATDRLRGTARASHRFAAQPLQERNDLVLAAASEVLEARAAAEPSPAQILRAQSILDEYPEMDAAAALALAADDTDDLDEAA